MPLFLLGLTLLALASVASAQPALQLGEPLERALVADDAHAYPLDLPADQFVLGDADQLTVDVVVTLNGPDGETLQTVDRTARGPERFQFTTEAAGTYTLTVTPYNGAEGRYTMRLNRAEPVATTPEGTVDQQLARFDDERSPGAAVAVVQGGAVVFARGYGSSNLEYGVPITTETVFYIGSVGKQFTAFAIALLADQGRLSLDEEIHTFLPELGVDQPVTVRQLLHHTSGLRDSFGLLGLAGGRDGDLVTQEIVRDLILRQRGLNFEPGTEFSYSNSNYILLAEIVERVTGDSFRSWMRENVFEPLGMNHTFVGDDHREIIPGRAASYAPEGGGYAKEVRPFSAYGAGGIYSTVGDLAHWLRNFRTAEVGGSAVARQMRERGILANGDTLGYALALFVDEHRGLQRIQHGGALAGYRSFIAYYPEIDAGVVTMGNVSSFNSGGVADNIAEAFFEDAFEPEDAAEVTEAEPAGSDYDPDSFDPAVFDAYAGRYEVDGSGYVQTYVRRGDRFYVQEDGEPEYELVPVGPATFEFQGVNATAEFVVGDDGEVARLVYTRGASYSAIRLTDDRDVTPGDYAGRYVSREVGAVYTVRVEGSDLVLAHPRLSEHVTLHYVTGERFRGGWPVTGLAFERGTDGTVTGFVAESVRTQGVRFNKVD